MRLNRRLCAATTSVGAASRKPGVVVWCHQAPLPSCLGAPQAALVGRTQSHLLCPTSLRYGRARSVARCSCPVLSPAGGPAPPGGPTPQHSPEQAQRAKRARPQSSSRACRPQRLVRRRSPLRPRSVRLPGSPPCPQRTTPGTGRNTTLRGSPTPAGGPAGAASRKPSQ